MTASGVMLPGNKLMDTKNVKCKWFKCHVERFQLIIKQVYISYNNLRIRKMTYDRYHKKR